MGIGLMVALVLPVLHTYAVPPVTLKAAGRPAQTEAGALIVAFTSCPTVMVRVLTAVLGQLLCLLLMVTLRVTVVPALRISSMELVVWPLLHA
jgi:hypothetical protein